MAQQFSLIPPLNYGLDYRGKEPVAPSPKTPPKEVFEEFYDDDWFPVKEGGHKFYRLGYKDSLGDWDGLVNDFYAEDDGIQMKGQYKGGLQEGVFIFYNEDSTYSSSGRYEGDFKVGKWEYFGEDNQLRREIRYIDGYSYIINSWDSQGSPMVVDGNGIEEYRYDNGVIEFRRELKEGRTDGYMESRYPDGSLEYRELFRNGNLIDGLSRTEDGAIHRYDIATVFPYPRGGFDQFWKYIETNNQLKSDTASGRVHIRFMVYHDGRLKDIRYLSRMGEPYDSHARDLILNGPEWIPAEAHGYSSVSSPADLYIDF